MLETLDDPTVHNMAIEEPEKANSDWLYILKELNEEDIIEIQKHVEVARKDKGDMLGFIITVDYVRQLGIRVELTNEDLQNLDHAAQNFREHGSFEELAMIAAYLKRTTGDSRLKKGYLDLIESELALTRGKNDLNGSVKLLISLHELGQQFTIDPGERNYLIENCIIFQSSERSLSNFLYWARLSTELGIEVNLNPNDLSRMKDKLESLYHEQQWVEFIELAADMKYLSEHLPSLNTESNLSSFTPPQPIGRDF